MPFESKLVNQPNETKIYLFIFFSLIVRMNVEKWKKNWVLEFKVFWAFAWFNCLCNGTYGKMAWFYFYVIHAQLMHSLAIVRIIDYGLKNTCKKTKLLNYCKQTTLNMRNRVFVTLNVSNVGVKSCMSFQ